MAKRYITQITAEELSGMLAAGKMKPGRGIKIDREGDAFVISIDDKVVLDIVWCFIRAGQATPAVVANDIKYVRNNVCTDPNFYT